MSYYEKVIPICRKYLKGDGEKFLARQTEGHLSKPPTELVPEDADSLAWWCNVSGKLVLGPAKASALSDEIRDAA